MRILDFVPTGHKNAISRQSLAILTKLSDRSMRDAIAEVNENGNPDELIINLQDGRGYFRPAPDEDNLVKIWRAQENNRKTNVNKNVKAADQYLNRNKVDELSKNQMSVFDYL